MSRVGAAQQLIGPALLAGCGWLLVTTLETRDRVARIETSLAEWRQAIEQRTESRLAAIEKQIDNLEAE